MNLFIKRKKYNKYLFNNIIIMTYLCGVLFSFSFFNQKINASMPSPVIDQASFISWLDQTGRPAYSRYHGYMANFDVFMNYQILSYGTPQIVPNNRYDSAARQYAIHGFSYDEYTVTNTFFRDDTTGVSDPRKWKNIALGQDAAISWMRLTEREKEHIRNSNLFYSGKDFNKMSYASLKLTESQCVVIAVPSWNLGFALYTKHYNSSGQIRYGTLTGSGIGGVTINGTISPAVLMPGNICTIESNQDYIDIAFNLNASINNYLGLARNSDISRGGIIFNNLSYESQGSGPWNSSQSVRFYRNAIDNTKDLTREITVKSTIWVVSALGDLVSNEVYYSFNLIERAKININGTMTMTGAISAFNNKKTVMGYKLNKNNKRFMCLEKITLRIDFDCNTLPEYVVFYPLGSSATKVFITKTSNTQGFAQYVYSMGVLMSSITWGGMRIRTPYQCTASAYYDNSRKDFMIDGIDITGDVYDLIYVQMASAKSRKLKN